MSLHRYSNSSHYKHPESSHKTTNTLNTRSSAYDRIFSAKNLISNTLPQFMVEFKQKEGITQLDLLRFNLTSKPKPLKVPPIMDLAETSIILKNLESPNDRLKINSDKLQDIKYAKKIIDDIFNPTFRADEIVLKISKRTLTRGDLLCFKEGDLPENVVDCYMSILKIENKAISKSNPQTKVIIVNSACSKQLFLLRKEIPRPKTDIFKYDALIFPIFDRYWSLISVDLNNGEISYFDGLMPNKDISGMTVLLLRFLLQANITNDSKINAEYFSVVENAFRPAVMSLKDSGVFICKVAECIAQNREIKEFDFRNTRKDMLNSLIRISSKINSNANF